MGVNSLYRIPSFENPRGLAKYKIFDTGVSNALRSGRNFLTRENLITLVINEIYAEYEYSGKQKPELFYYRTRGGAEIDLVIRIKDKLIGIECAITDDISPYMQRGMKSFIEKYSSDKRYGSVTGYFIAPVQKHYNLEKNIQVIPWNSIG